MAGVSPILCRHFADSDSSISRVHAKTHSHKVQNPERTQASGRVAETSSGTATRILTERSLHGHVFVTTGGLGFVIWVWLSVCLISSFKTCNKFVQQRCADAGHNSHF